MATRANSTPDIRLAGTDHGPVNGPFQGMAAKGWWTDDTATWGLVWRAFGKSLEDADRSRVARTAYSRTLGRLDKNTITLRRAVPNLNAVRVALDRAPVFFRGRLRTSTQSIGRIIGASIEVSPSDRCGRHQENINAMMSYGPNVCLPEIGGHLNNVAFEVMARCEHAIMRNISHRNALECDGQASVR